MRSDGDIRVTPTLDGGRIDMTGGQPAMDPGLMTAVYLSLFTEPGYWGASLLPVAVGSGIPALFDEPLTNATRLAVIEAARNALAWMIAQGVAESVEPEATITGPGSLSLEIAIQQPAPASPLTLRYRMSWAEQAAILEEAN